MQALNYFHDFVSIFYPRICPGCGSPMQRTEKHICLTCLVKLPRTRFDLRADNPVEKLFRGRLPIEQGNSFMYFRKKGLAQGLMHELKYNGNRELGVHLGALFAAQVADGLQGCKPDVITTVPLHHRKLLKRGFNQSDEIAKGFTSMLDIPFMPGLLQRLQDSATQTHKKRFERWENTQGSFVVPDMDVVAGKHIGIVDDVITTGATLESCGQKLAQAAGVKLSVFSLCIAIH